MLDFVINVIYSILLIGFGYIIIRYRKEVKEWTGGGFIWAEQYIGRGGTYLVIVLIGLFCIFAGAVLPFGGFDFMNNK